MKKLIIIAGATAVGKTDFSIEMARKINGEIICGDSMQVYKYMNIGTAKPSNDEMSEIKHHLFDFVSPNVNYTVSDYNKDARKVIDDINSKGKIPIVVGGSGLYIHSLIYNMDFNDVKPNYEFRDKLLVKDSSELCEMLNAKGVELTSSDKNNKRRLVRMIEILEFGGDINKFRKNDEKVKDYEVKLYFLERDRRTLYDRINKRVDIMLENGLVDEVEHLLNMGVDRNAKSMQAIGYKEVVEYVLGEISKDEMVVKLKQNTRRYAKRQNTWFKRYKNEEFYNLKIIC